jgi:ABC-type histidine transport system ATPase subunit
MPVVSHKSPSLWTRGVAARETLSYLDRRGIDAKPALFEAGLSRRQLSREGIGLSVASQYRFLHFDADAAHAREHTVGDLVGDVASIVARLKAAQLACDALLDDVSQLLGYVHSG